MVKERKKEKSQGFAALGIPIGSTLVFKKDPAITVKTLDDRNKVEYLGKPYSISTLAKQFVGSPVSGYLYFKFEGKALKSFTGNKVGNVAAEIAESPAPEPAEEAAKIPDTPLELDDEDTTDDFELGLDPLVGGVEVESEVSPPNKAEIGGEI
jgi:hypothetical protein